MATYWVRTAVDGGSDLNTGVDYDHAKATLSGVLAIAGVATTPGHTINIVAHAGSSHVMEAFPGTAIGAAGTNHTTSPGMVIRGVLDATEAPAMAKVAATGTSTRLWVRVNASANYVTIQGIKFDYSALLADNTVAKDPIQFEGNVKYHRVLDCECWFSATVGASTTVLNTSSPRFPYYSGASGATAGEVEVARCVTVNCRAFSAVLSTAAMNMHHNIIIRDGEITGTDYALLQIGAGTPSGGDSFYNNTFVNRKYLGTTATGKVASCFNDVATDRPYLRFNDNLIYAECSSAATSPGVSNFLLQGATQAVSSGGSIGNDVFAIGPLLSAFIAAGWNNATQGYTSYQLNQKWRASDAGWLGTDIPATSDTHTSAAFLDVFNALGSYTWTPSIYSHVLPYDLRPRLGVTSSSTGGYVGAVQAAPPTVVDDAYSVGANLLLTEPVGTGVLANDTDPNGLAMTASLVDDVAYGVLALAANGSFTYNAAGVFNTAVTFTYRATNTLGLVSSLATVTITVGDLPPVDPDIDDPVAQTGHNYLDSYPFYRPVFKATTETMVRVKRNRVEQHTDMRHYLQEHVHDESTSRCVQIAGSGTFACSLGGVYRATGVLLETDQQISVVVTHFDGVADSTFTVTVNDSLVLSQCAVTQLDITNLTISVATVQMVAFD